MSCSDGFIAFEGNCVDAVEVEIEFTQRPQGHNGNNNQPSTSESDWTVVTVSGHTCTVKVYHADASHTVRQRMKGPECCKFGVTYTLERIAVSYTHLTLPTIYSV